MSSLTVAMVGEAVGEVEKMDCLRGMYNPVEDIYTIGYSEKQAGIKGRQNASWNDDRHRSIAIAAPLLARPALRSIRDTTHFL